MDETGVASRPYAKTVVAMALAGLLSLASFPTGVYLNDVASGILGPFFVSNQDQFAFLDIIFVYPQTLDPWIVQICFHYIVPFLLFFFLAGWANVDPYNDIANVAGQSFGWGIVVNLIGPILADSVFVSGEISSVAQVSVVQSVRSAVLNPFGDFGIAGGAVIFATIAVTGVTIGYFWRQDHYRTIRSWLEKEEDAPSEELAEAETRDAV